MRAFQLTDMLVTLRGVLEEHPQGFTLDAEMVGALVSGLADMEQAAETLQQAAIDKAETVVGLVEDLRHASEYFRTCVRSQLQPSVQDCLDWMRFFSALAVKLEQLYRIAPAPEQLGNIIPFPVIARPIPAHGGAA